MNRKKIIALIIGILSISVVLVILFTNLCSFKQSGEDSYTKNIKILNEQDVTLLIYGDSIDFKNGVQYDNISEIDKTNFKGNDFLVINDRSSNVLLNDDDYVEIKELVAAGVTLMYFGDSKLDEFKDNGFYNSYTDCLGFHISAIDSTVTFGLWSIEDEEIYKTNKNLLGQTVVETIVYELKK